MDSGDQILEIVAIVFEDIGPDLGRVFFGDFFMTCFVVCVGDFDHFQLNIFFNEYFVEYPGNVHSTVVEHAGISGCGLVGAVEVRAMGLAAGSDGAGLT